MENSISPDVRELFHKIAQAIMNEPAKYREAGKWLDEYCSEDAYLKRQEDNLKELQAQKKRIPTLPIVRDLMQLEKEIEEKHILPLLLRFQAPQNHLVRKYKDQEFIPVGDARRIILITWLLTDPDAEKANLNVTELEKWQWEPIDDVLSRSYAGFLFCHGGIDRDPWMKLVRVAWTQVGTQKQDEVPSHESGRIFGQTWTVGGVPIHLRNLVAKVKGLKRWQKIISYFGLCIVILLIVGFSTRALWLPLIGKLASDSSETSMVSAHTGRPMVIFDANESIHVDGGAMQYLEQIEVEEVATVRKVGEDESYVYELKIIVIPKHHLAYGPLIEPLGGLRSIIIYDPTRGVGHQWVYQALIRPPYGGDIRTQKFRLEILK